MIDPDDDREIADVPPDETPAGYEKVQFNVPMPTLEQITGEVARQLIRSQDWQSKSVIDRAVRERINAAIDQVITARAVTIIEDLMSKPLQPTDNFGNPIGEPTSLQGVLAARVTDWCTDVVDSEGRPAKQDSYSRHASRMAWQLGKIVNGELKKAVDAETARIVQELRGSATNVIAKQIADKISGLVVKAA